MEKKGFGSASIRGLIGLSRIFLAGASDSVLFFSSSTVELALAVGRGPLGPPPGPVLAGGALQPGRELKTAYRLPPGQYFIVLDHTASAGTVNPPPTIPLNPLAPPATVSVAVQLGEY